MKIFRRGVWENLIRLTGIVVVLGSLFVLPVSAQEMLPNLFSEADINAPQMDLSADYTGEVADSPVGAAAGRRWPARLHL
ncbi:MAG: hypothetical protein P8046_04150 [Anaerolineales bacterium]